MPYVGKKPADIIATAVDTTTGTFSGEVDAASLDISGNIDVDGTTNLDAVDIDGAVDINAQTNIHSNLVLDDSNKIILGNGSDLQLYHDGSNSYVDEQGTGNLIIRGTQIQLKASDGTSYAEFTDGGASVLRHSGDLKLTTESGGIAVTGTISASSGDITITDGNLVVASGHGIDFSATANASSGNMSSELFDTYEEGTFTPKFTFGGGSSGQSYSTVRNGFYTRVGDTVFITVRLELTARGSSTGTIRIADLPLTSVSTANSNCGFYIGFMANCGSNFDDNNIHLVIDPNTSTITFRRMSSGGSQDMAESNLGNSSQLIVNGFYRTA